MVDAVSDTPSDRSQWALEVDVDLWEVRDPRTGREIGAVHRSVDGLWATYSIEQRDYPTAVFAELTLAVEHLVESIERA